MLAQELDIARELGFGRVLCVCDEDNIASERVIIKTAEYSRTDCTTMKKKFCKRYWIDL